MSIKPARPNPARVQGTGTEAERLYDAGLNPLPIIPGTKKTYGRWGFLTTTRLWRQTLASLVEGSNVAVVTGRPSGNLFIIDCDTEADYLRIGDLLSNHGLRPWVSRTVRGGHYWFRCSDGEVKTVDLRPTGFAGEIKGNRTYVVAPPSVHPDGGMVYEWIDRQGDFPPLVSLTELSFLPFCVQLATHAAKRRRTHVLPPVAHRVLIDRDTTDYGTDNSSAEFAACMSLIGDGYPDAEIVRLFKTFNPPHYADHGEAWFIRYMLRPAHLRANAPDATPRDNDSAPQSAAFVKWANSRPWPGRKGSTDRAIYLAYCERLRLDRRTPFRASVREIADLAGVASKTAHASTRRLVSARLVTHTGEDKQAGAFLWTLHIGKEHTGVTDTVGEAYNPVRDSVSLMHTASDVWHRRGLGKSGFECWSLIMAEPALTAAMIAERTGRSRKTVATKIGALKRHGLLDGEDGAWKPIRPDADALNSIATRLGTAGSAERRKAKHDEERARHASEIVQRQMANWLAQIKHSSDVKLSCQKGRLGIIGQ